MSNIKRDTNIDLFKNVIEMVKSNGHFEKAAAILDYSLPSSRIRELTNYQFDFRALVNWGSSEGIYMDCYIEGNFDSSDDRKLHVGTFKTLLTSIEAFQIMGELAGALTFYEYQYVNKNLARYEPVAV